MRGYVGTFWRFQFFTDDEEFLVVDEGDDGAIVVFEVETQTFHQVKIMGWGDLLWMRRSGEYSINHTLMPVKPLKRQITTLGSAT